MASMTDGVEVFVLRGDNVVKFVDVVDGAAKASTESGRRDVDGRLVTLVLERLPVLVRKYLLILFRSGGKRFGNVWLTVRDLRFSRGSIGLRLGAHIHAEFCGRLHQRGRRGPPQSRRLSDESLEETGVAGSQRSGDVVQTHRSRSAQQRFTQATCRTRQVFREVVGGDGVGIHGRHGGHVEPRKGDGVVAFGASVLHTLLARHLTFHGKSGQHHTPTWCHREGLRSNHAVAQAPPRGDS